MSQNDPSETGKAMAGARAAEAVTPGMRLGLGTGSTVAHFLRALGRRVQDGELPGIVGVPTSLHTEAKAGELGIPLGTLQEVRFLDLTVDGADEVTPELDLIKGLGGALLREKMVAQATARLVIIADRSKLVDRLGTRSPLPVEVVPFAWESHIHFLEELGARAVIRSSPTGDPFLTDNGNLILDCHFSAGINDPWGLQEALAARAGVVESGLFLGMAVEALVGGEGDVMTLSRIGDRF
ncbi:MAG: ribose-5-phosphate isomerase RpiA [Gemmatimonadota bacterium]